ncbi:MAG: aminomethyltransferase family protein [Proteobacteria bacterium]|nr:aminomethyltransferase family protein [Pseudomonadota bacterium]
MLTETAPHFRQPLLKTPFHERQREYSQLDSYVPWAGYSTFDVFTNVEQEYFSVRNASSLYDLTPMVKYRVSGPDALRFLNRLVTRDMGKLSPGKVAYTVWCDDAGKIIDDGTVFCLAANDYRVCTAERQLDWFEASAIGYDVEIREITEEVAALAVQGPISAKLLRGVGIAGIERLKPFEHGEFSMPRAGGGPTVTLMVSRTGFTGDLGYELWMQPQDAEAVWDALMEFGRTRAVRPIGSKALNMVRIEAGFILPKVDFVSAAHTLYLGTERSPIELGLSWLIDYKKGHFTGRRALLQEVARGPRRQLVGLDIEGTKPAYNALLYTEASGRREAGSVTSAIWSPTCKRNLALAMVDAPFIATGSTLWAEVYLNRELVWERRMVRARVVDRPFFAPARRRTTPPADF